MTNPQSHEHRDQLDQDVYLALSKTSVLLDDLDRRLFASYDLSARQFWALSHLEERQGRPMAELGHLLLTDKSNVTGIVDHLERSGLAARTPAAHDRRVIHITLTPKGRRLRDLVSEQHRARVHEVLEAMDSQRLQQLLAAVHEIQQHLSEHLARAHPTELAALG